MAVNASDRIVCWNCYALKSLGDESFWLTEFCKWFAIHPVKHKNVKIVYVYVSVYMRIYANTWCQRLICCTPLHILVY